MYFHIMIGTGSYTTSTTNMYNKTDFTYLKANVQQRPPVVATGAFQLGGFDGNDGPYLNISKIGKKTLVLIVLSIVFKHTTKI